MLLAEKHLFLDALLHLHPSMTLQSFLFISIALLGVFFANDANADQNFDSAAFCSEVRLDKGNGPFTVIPVYDQKLNSPSDPDICYAVTASQIIDAYRYSQHKTLPTLTSPLSIALKSRSDDSKNSTISRLGVNDTNPVTYMVGGGSIYRAIISNKNEVVCDQNWLENTFGLIGNQQAQPIENFLISSKASNSQLSPSVILSALAKLQIECGNHLFKLSIPHVAQLEAPGGDYFEALFKLTERLKYPNLTTQERKKLVADFEGTFDPDKKINLFLQQTHKFLSGKNPKPVGIGFLYRALKAKSNVDSIGGHASVIIGRRFNANSSKCELLVRDSYGSSCTDKNGTLRYGLPCENGSVWVEARTLFSDTFNLTWIP